MNKESQKNSSSSRGARRRRGDLRIAALRSQPSGLPRSLWSLAMTLILSSVFFIPQQALVATDVVEVGSFCFRKDECKTYNASPSPYEVPECKNPSPGHNARAVTLEYKFNCYANQRPTKLQVSIGGYEVPGIEEYIKRLYIYLISIVGIVAGIMYVWAGTKWLTSAGAPERITDAKKKIGNASVGLVLVLASYLILQLVNPALIELKLPPVKIVRRDLGETQEWCVKRTEFPCGGIHLKQEGGAWIPDPSKPADPDGKWDCSDPAYLQANPSNPPCEGGSKGGMCYGQYCPQGGSTGCQRLVMDRLVSLNLKVAAEDKLKRIVRKCFNPADCNNCNVGAFMGPPTAEEYAQGHRFDTLHLDKVALCISTACNCIAVGDNINDGSPDPFRCTRRILTGQHCESDQECESNNCNFALGNKCGPSPNNSSCQDDADCASGICNTADNTGSKCIAPNSLNQGDDCIFGKNMCRPPFVCGLPGVVTDPECERPS